MTVLERLEGGLVEGKVSLGAGELKGFNRLSAILCAPLSLPTCRSRCEPSVVLATMPLLHHHWLFLLLFVTMMKYCDQAIVLGKDEDVWPCWRDRL